MMQAAMTRLGERYLKIQARKDEALARATKMIVELGEFYGSEHIFQASNLMIAAFDRGDASAEYSRSKN